MAVRRVFRRVLFLALPPAAAVAFFARLAFLLVFFAPPAFFVPAFFFAFVLRFALLRAAPPAFLRLAVLERLAVVLFFATE